MHALRRFGTVCCANLPYKVVAVVIALVLHYFALQRANDEAGPPRPPECGER